MANVLPEVDRQAAALAGVQARRKRAIIKKEIFHGERSAHDVLVVASIDPSSSEATLRITDFLKSLRGVGETKIASVMSTLKISPKKRLGGLGKHQLRGLKKWVLDYESHRNLSWPLYPVILLGPSGVGKGTIASLIKQKFPEVHLSISATTRSPRPLEIDGVNYFFVDNGEFDAMIAENKLLEWAEVHGNVKYGTPRGPIDQAIENNIPVLLEIDLQGARQVKKTLTNVRTVFILPPDWDELVRRLKNRGTETEEEITRRLETAYGELAAKDECDVRVINDDVNIAVQHVVELMGLNKER